jgi:homoaconitate hydratase
MVEYGYATPGSMVVGSDSHSNLYGAVNCLGTPVVRTDAACIWATGQTWWQVPRVARVELTGKMQRGVVGKDVIIALCGAFNQDEVLNMAVEFTGNGIDQLSMDQRMSIANMTTEWGALAGVFPFDERLLDYLYDCSDFLAARAAAGAVDNASGAEPRIVRGQADGWFAKRVRADHDASYAIDLTLDLSTVIPHVSGPDHVKVMHSLPEMERRQVRIDKAYLLSCVNARLEDLQEAAEIVEGRKVAEGVEFYVAAASANVQREAEAQGHWSRLMECGAIALPPGCGTCIGLGAGTLGPGEVAISATNRNFKGRMGSRDAQAYLGSPAVVAASAIAGYICAPQPFEDRQIGREVVVHDAPKGGAAAAGVIDGFPPLVTGRVLWLPVDNLNTDGIYAGTLTYRDEVTDDEMKAAAMANYDPRFASIARAEDIIVAGDNFGTGSSREQAVTCLKMRGIACVIAASFSETYKRNAFNNGFIVFECPGLVAHLRQRHEQDEALTITLDEAVIDYRASVIRLDTGQFSFAPLSAVAQELILAGGAEALARGRLETEVTGSA